MTRFKQIKAEAVANAVGCTTPEQAAREGEAFAGHLAKELLGAGHADSTVWLSAECMLYDLLKTVPRDSIPAAFYDAAYAALRTRGSYQPATR